MSQHGKHRTARDPIAIMEGLLDDVAEQAVEDHAPTADNIRWSREVGEKVARVLARMERRSSRRMADQVVPSVGVSPEVAALDRESLLARLDILNRDNYVQFLNQDLRGLSDDELRRMLAHALTVKEG